LKFNFHTPVTDKTSYGLVAINIAANLSCNIMPIGNVFGNVPKKVKEACALGEFDINLPTIKLYHQFDLGTFGRNKRIGFPIFELDRFNHIEIAHLSSCDELIVCSKWAKEVINGNNITVPTHVVPLGVDNTIFAPAKLDQYDYIFLSAGKWEVRKGQDDIVTAFNMAFQPTDKTQLWLSMHNQFMRDEEVSKIKKKYLDTAMGRAGKIKFVGPFDKQKELARIMNMSSCGVFPSRAEGWGLETLEMMACGKPVIVTNYSGHTEFCDETNSSLIPVTTTEPAKDNKWFFGQGNWACIEIDILATLMRENFKIGPRVSNGGLETAKKFTWQNTAKLIEEIVS